MHAGAVSVGSDNAGHMGAVRGIVRLVRIKTGRTVFFYIPVITVIIRRRPLVILFFASRFAYAGNINAAIIKFQISNVLITLSADRIFSRPLPAVGRVSAFGTGTVVVIDAADVGGAKLRVSTVNAAVNHADGHSFQLRGQIAAFRFSVKTRISFRRADLRQEIALFVFVGLEIRRIDFIHDFPFAAARIVAAAGFVTGPRRAVRF